MGNDLWFVTFEIMSLSLCSLSELQLAVYLLFLYLLILLSRLPHLTTFTATKWIQTKGDTGTNHEMLCLETDMT